MLAAMAPTGDVDVSVAVRDEPGVAGDVGVAVRDDPDVIGRVASDQNAVGGLDE
jgi:hypothetical protein